LIVCCIATLSAPSSAPIRSKAGKMVSIENGPNIARPPSRKARRRSGTADGGDVVMGDEQGKGEPPGSPSGNGRPSYAACPPDTRDEAFRDPADTPARATRLHTAEGYPHAAAGL